MKINPVFSKELKVAVRTPRFAAKLVAYNLVLMIITMLAYYASFGEYYGNYYRNYYNVIIIYSIMAFLEMGLIVFAIPSFTAGSIAGEREKQTLDILLTTTLKPRQIILGKLLSSISLMLLLYFSSLPIISIVFSIGGIPVSSLLELTVLAVSTALYIGSIGMYFSTKLKKSIPATVFTYGGTLLILVGTYVVIAGVFLVMSLFFRVDTIGVVVLILLINPVMSGVAMMTRQFGSATEFTAFLDQVGYCPSFISEHWFGISIMVQLAIGGLFLYGAWKTLDPIKKKSRKGRSHIG